MTHKQEELTPQFVEFIPEYLAEGHLYISERYNTAVHLCCCGCGEEVVTPLTPADWQLRKVGNKVSLHPSIGNWDFTCKSHYWIRGNRVMWAAALNSKQIKMVQANDRRDKALYIEAVNADKQASREYLDTTHCGAQMPTKNSLLSRIWKAFWNWL